MKFKSTTKQPKALLYKRFIGLEKSINLAAVYYTASGANFLYWTFDYVSLEFSQVNKYFVNAGSNIVFVLQNTILQYQNTYFRYNFDNNVWEKTTNPASGTFDIELLSATFNNISKYQTNKYYFVGSFDFMIKGSVEGTNAQFIKGNIIPLTSFNIKYFDDDIQLNQDDLVVIDKHLYSVENPETDIKYNPKPYKIHFATLNSIL